MILDYAGKKYETVVNHMGNVEGLLNRIYPLKYKKQW